MVQFSEVLDTYEPPTPGATATGLDARIIAQNGGATSGNGGAVLLQAGNAVGASNAGSITLVPGSGSGADGHLVCQLPSYADDAAAAAGGVPINGLYRTSSTVKVRIA